MSTDHALQRLQQLISLERDDIVTLVIYGVGIGLMSLAMPVAVQALVNTIAFGALLQPLFVLTVILFVLLSFSNMLVALQFYVVEMLQMRLFIRMFGDSAQRLQQAAFQVHDSQYLPELANRFFDVASLQKGAAALLLETLGYVLQTLIGMILLAFYHPMLLAFDLFLIGALYLILFVLGKQGIDTVIEQSKAKYLAAAWLESIAATPLLNKSQTNAHFIQQQTEKIANQYLQACISHFRVLSRQNIGALVLHTLANSLLLAMGGWMVIERQLSLGQLIAAELVVNAMVYGLTRLGKTLDNFYELVASVDKLGYLLDLPAEAQRQTAILPTNQPYQINISQLQLSGSPQLDAINNLNLQLKAREHLVISQGAEHGSLLDVIYGLRQPLQGQIQLNQHDLRDINLGVLRDSVALVREAEIIPSSIQNNLCLGREHDPNELRQILQQLDLHNIIASLPDSINSQLMANGVPLTAEQSLRLTLARSLAAKPQLLLIDKVFDRLAPQTLPAILQTVFAESAPWTVIVISQLPQVIALCQRHGQFHNGQWQEV